MADSFFGFDTSLSNLNDEDCGAEPSEEEYDALNNETFGQDSQDFDWEVEHEHLAEQLESSRRQNAMDEADSVLEASLSQLVLDEIEHQPRVSLGSNVWRHDFFSTPPPSVPPIKTVCTVEELERQLRQNQQPHNFNQNYCQPRYPVILQRPPGLQGPVSLPFAPQQSLAHNINQINQPVNQIISQNQMGQNNQMMQNHLTQNLGQMNQNMSQVQQMNQYMQNNQINQFSNNQIGQGVMQMNQMGQNVIQMNQSQLYPNQMSQNQMPHTQMGQNLNQMGQNTNQMGQNTNQMGQNLNQMGQNMNQIGQNVNQMGQNVNQMGQNVNQISQNVNQIGQNINQMGQNVHQMGQNVNQIGQNMNQMGQNMNQIMPNGNFGQNQYQHMGMGQPRMMAPPPGMGLPRQNFNQYNPNFRGPIATKNDPNNPPMNHVKNQPINQIKPANPIQSPVKKRPEPKIKSRVYSNSQNKTLTSQNMVQIIQNTHPMLSMYNSLHNANHHPMLARNYNNQIVHPMFGQRNGGFGNAVSRNSNDSSTASESDEYAGLMTQREKQWLINIQMLQLNTGTPYIHDFYYTVFLERKANKEKAGIKEAHKANQQNHPFYSGGVKQEDQHRHNRERHNSHRHNSTSEDATRTYVPTQFENSLGKLQCGSVTAPRKIIDVDLVGSEQSSSRLSRAPSVASTHAAEFPREMRRTKQLLLDIEALYLILLRLEELNDPLAISNALILKEREEKQKQLEAAQKEAEIQDDESNVFLKNIESVQRRPKQDSPKSECIDKRQVVNLAMSQKPVPAKNLLDEDKDDLLNKILAGLLYGDRLPQMLSVRKGRTMVSRLLCRVPVTHCRLRSLWLRILRALSATRRDLGLHGIAIHYRKYIQNSTGWTAVLEACGILTEALDPARTPYVLVNGLTPSCVCVLAEKAMVLSNTPEATSSERQWFKFLKTVARALKSTTLKVARPVTPLSESKLLHHIKLLESRSTIEILQRGKRASDFGDLSKTDVSELLVKYLC